MPSLSSVSQPVLEYPPYPPAWAYKTVNILWDTHTAKGYVVGKWLTVQGCVPEHTERSCIGLEISK